MASKSIIVALPAEEYRRLEQRAAEQDRDVWLEARHLIRQALKAAPEPAPAAPERGHVRA